VAAHDLADPLDVWWATAADDLGDLLEIAGAQQTGTDDRQEASIMAASVVEAVDDAALNEKRLTRVKINLLAGHGERGDTF
jgi:sugar phosphate isomerase/epimerase